MHRTLTLASFGIAAALGVFTALLTAGPAGRAADLQDLDASAKETRAAAVARLSQGANAASDAISDLAGEHSPLVRAGLVEAIDKAGGPSRSDAAALARLMTSPELGIRFSAVRVALKNPGIVKDDLTRRLMDENEDSLVRRAAARALGNTGPQSRATLLRFANGDDDAVREAAIRALADAGLEAAKDLEAIAKDARRDTEERHLAIRSLAASSDGNAALTRLATNATAFVRAHALAGIGRCGSASDAPTLVALLADPVADVRYEALRALQALKLDAANVAPVAVCLGDADVRIQLLACQILEATKAAGFNAVLQGQLQALVASPTFLVRHGAAKALFAYGDNFGAAQMAIDKGAGSLSQRKMASQAHALITGKGK